MKKKIISVIIATMLFVIIVLPISSSAAYSNPYSGSCNTNFFTSTTVNSASSKTRGYDYNSSASYAGSASTYYTSRLYLSNKTTKAQANFMEMTSGAAKSNPIIATYRNPSYSFRLKVANMNTGYKLTVSGTYGVY